MSYGHEGGGWMNEDQRSATEGSGMGDGPRVAAAWKYRPGGLLRCCIATLAQMSRMGQHEGEVVECHWCEGNMAWKDGAWEWANPDPAGEL